jgi:hypothetical protein
MVISLLRLLRQLGNSPYTTPPKHLIHLISTTTYVSRPYARRDPRDTSPVASALPFAPSPDPSICPSCSRLSSFPQFVTWGRVGCHDAGEVQG